jgi:hypothetical protein
MTIPRTCLPPFSIIGLMAFTLQLQPTFSNPPEWDVTLAGGYSHFGESAGALGLDPTIQIDRRGNAKYVALDKLFCLTLPSK